MNEYKPEIIVDCRLPVTINNYDAKITDTRFFSRTFVFEQKLNINQALYVERLPND